MTLAAGSLQSPQVMLSLLAREYGHVDRYGTGRYNFE